MHSTGWILLEMPLLHIEIHINCTYIWMCVVAAEWWDSIQFEYSNGWCWNGKMRGICYDCFWNCNEHKHSSNCSYAYQNIVVQSGNRKEVWIPLREQKGKFQLSTFPNDFVGSCDRWMTLDWSMAWIINTYMIAGMTRHYPHSKNIGVFLP